MNDAELLDEPPPPLAVILASHPGWATMTAFERAKLCCAELTRRGERLPNWAVIRDVIGKGSATDINRAKEAFRREHADALRRLDRAVDGVPEELQAAFREIWALASRRARDDAAVEMARAEAMVRDARALVNRAEDAARMAEARCAALEDERRALEARLAAEREKAAALDGALARADQDQERLRAALEEERRQAREEVAAEREKLKSALERLQDMEAFVLRRVVEERAAAEAKFKAELEEARSQLSFLQARLAKSETDEQRLLDIIAELRRDLADRRRDIEGLRRGLRSPRVPRPVPRLSFKRKTVLD